MVTNSNRSPKLELCQCFECSDELEKPTCQARNGARAAHRLVSRGTEVEPIRGLSRETVGHRSNHEATPVREARTQFFSKMWSGHSSVLLEYHFPLL
jgi:hypothetical protein